MLARPLLFFAWASKLPRKCESKHWLPCGADGLSFVRSAYGQEIAAFSEMGRFTYRSAPQVRAWAPLLAINESEWSVPHFCFYNQNNSTSSPGLLGNGALTCSGLHFWPHFFVKHKILLNSVTSNWVWWIMRVLLATRNWGKNLNEL